MKSEISFEKKEGYLSVTISGKHNKIEFISYAKIIRDKCEKENIYKVLFNGLDVKETNLSKLDKYFIGIEFANVFKNTIKIVYVLPKKDLDGFSGIVASNRVTKMKGFSDLDSAKRWLFNTMV